MYKSESSQSRESRAHLVDSSKAYSKPRASNCQQSLDCIYECSLFMLLFRHPKKKKVDVLAFSNQNPVSPLLLFHNCNITVTRSYKVSSD